MESYGKSHLTVVFGPEIWELQPIGGISRYFSKLIENYKVQGVKVHAFLTANDNFFSSRLNCEKYFIEERRDFERYLQRIASSTNGLKIYHATYYDHNKIKIAKKMGFKTFITIHDMISEIFPERKSIFHLFKNDKRTAARIVDRILTVSANTKTDLIHRFNIPPIKIDVTHLGSIFEGEEFIPRAEDFESNTFLYVGKRGGYKNFDEIINAFANSSILKARARLIAFGGGLFSSDELSKLKNLSLDGCVQHVSGDDTALRDLYLNSLALIYPSTYEGFGLPPLEAMSLGCPVLIRSNSSLHEVSGEAGIYFGSGNFDNLATLMLYCLDNPKFLFEHSKNGIHRSRQFSWTRTVRESLDAYRR